MGIIYFSEQPPVLSANIIVLVVQIMLHLYSSGDFILNGVLLLLSGLVVFPLLYYSYRQVKVNNYLIRNGKIVEAKINRDETKITFAVKTTVMLQVKCFYYVDGQVYIFKGEYAFSMYDKKKVLKYLENVDTVQVLVDDSFKTYKILFHSLLHELYDDVHYECPRILNYIVLIINVGCGFINLLS